MQLKLRSLLFPLPSIILLFSSLPNLSESSLGDRSEVYQQCLKRCRERNCSNPLDISNYERNRPWYLTSWSCEDECSHGCMWHTVDWVQRKGYKIPQFHGKWPFVRICGIQEPASFIFSILNGLSHFLMWKKLRKMLPGQSALGIWNMQALLSINAWIWSAVFHARDTPVTEKLDYYCAFSLVLYSLYCLVVKAFSKELPSLQLTLSVPFLMYFTYHVHYLSFVKFDYGYNLRANIFFGIVNAIGWLIWCYVNKCKPHVWKCAISVVVLSALLLLEVADFPPLGFFIDAHALWHLGTIPIPVLWYNFLIEDTLYDKKAKKNE